MYSIDLGLLSRVLTSRLSLVFRTLNVKVISVLPLGAKTSLRSLSRSVGCDRKDSRLLSQSLTFLRPSGFSFMSVVCSCCLIRSSSADRRRVDRRDVRLQSLHDVTD